LRQISSENRLKIDNAAVDGEKFLKPVA
jgi:hypothetical protein